MKNRQSRETMRINTPSTRIGHTMPRNLPRTSSTGPMGVVCNSPSIRDRRSRSTISTAQKATMMEKKKLKFVTAEYMAFMPLVIPIIVEAMGM